MALDLSRISRVLSHALRHEPWLYELELDDEGWAPLADVLAALGAERTEWSDVTEADLARLIETSSKRRYELGDGRIRALYGHSLADKLNKTPGVPPEILFHGTDPDVVPVIRVTGLLPMRRQYVHLSVEQAMASEVGRRKARQPVILGITARDAHASGVIFYEGNAQVWLADVVPPQFIEFP